MHEYIYVYMYSVSPFSYTLPFPFSWLLRRLSLPDVNVLAPLQDINLHPNLHPRLQKACVANGVFGRGREDWGQHHAKAAELRGALIDIAVFPEIAVRLNRVGDTRLWVYVRQLAAGVGVSTV